MTAKNLSEAAMDILSGNVTSKRASAEPFGAGKTEHSPQPAGHGVDLGGPGVDADSSGIAAASKAGPTATPPGKTPPVGSQKRHANPGAKAVAIPEEDEVEEEAIEEEGHSEFEKNTQATRPELSSDGQTTLGIPKAEPVSARVKAYVKSKQGASGALSEDFAAMFDGEGLSEEFKTKIATIFESAVTVRATQIAEAVESELVEEFEALGVEILEQMETKVDDYLNYVVEEWVSDNAVAIESGLRAELAEDFIAGLKTLFTEHYIDIPEEKVDVVEELTATVESLEAKLNEEIDRGISLNKELVEHKKVSLVAEHFDGLTDTQAEKLLEQSRGLEFVSEEDFYAKVKTLRESYFPENKATSGVTQLDEESVEGDVRGVVETSTDRTMDAYMNAIGRQAAAKKF